MIALMVLVLMFGFYLIEGVFVETHLEGGSVKLVGYGRVHVTHILALLLMAVVFRLVFTEDIGEHKSLSNKNII